MQHHGLFGVLDAKKRDHVPPTPNAGTYSYYGATHETVARRRRNGAAMTARTDWRVKKTILSCLLVLFVTAADAHRPATAKPSPPSGVRVTTISNKALSVTWRDNSSNETQFRIERKKGTSGSWSQIAKPGQNVTSYTDSGLSSNTTYYYRLRACNGEGCSAYSSSASGITKYERPP